MALKSRILLTALLALGGCEQQAADPTASNAAQAPPVTDADLRAAAQDPRVAQFYDVRGWHAAWTEASEADLRRALAGANAHALNSQEYLGPLAAAQSGAAHDAALTLAALSYGEALAHGRTDPARLHQVYTVPRPRAELGQGLEDALGHHRVADWLASLAPQDAEYRALSAAYLDATRQLQPAAPHQGGAPSGTAPVQPAASGVLDRARALAVNLERRRWLERDPPATRIDVNTGAALLTYWRDGQARDSRRVVAGEPGRETPELGTRLYRLVANPTWTVPHSIEHEVSSAAYMRRHHMVRRDGWIVQQSGPFNALGLVKFDLQNDQQIYLHDTPSKGLFARDERHASHGCVRVSDALGFAELIAGDAGLLDAWHRARAAHDEGFVPLPHPIPVRLMYQTAFLQDGRIVFVRDAYGWDEDVAEALGLPARSRAQNHRADNDLGP